MADLSRLPGDYRSGYERGWRYSARPSATLDHLDARDASEAEYDGYLDMAVGREKWHLAFCDSCPEHPGHTPAVRETPQD